MRPQQKSNRSRGRGNRKGGGGGGGGNNINRVFDSAGPEGKVRGTPQQIIDKYLSLARDAQTSGDRVTSENFLQHAEHYQRILIQATQAQEQVRRESEPAPTPETSAGHTPVESNSGVTPAPAAASVAEDPAKAAQPEIGGMAMIDAGAVEEPLPIGAEVAETPKPRGNGETPRRRSRKKPVPVVESPAAESAAPEGPASQEASAES